MGRANGERASGGVAWSCAMRSVHTWRQARGWASVLPIGDGWEDGVKRGGKKGVVTVGAVLEGWGRGGEERRNAWRGMWSLVGKCRAEVVAELP